MTFIWATIIGLIAVGVMRFLWLPKRTTDVATGDAVRLQREAVESCIGTLNDLRQRLALQNARLGRAEWSDQCDYQLDLVGKTLDLQRQRAVKATAPLDGFGEQLSKSMDTIEAWDAKVADRVVADTMREAAGASGVNFGRKPHG